MYSSPDSLPEFLRKFLPKEALVFFYDVYASACKNYDEQTAFQYAWEATKMRMQKQNGMYVVHNHYYGPHETEDSEPEGLQTLDMIPEETKVTMNAETDELILEAVLADTNPTTENKLFTEDELVALADQINTLGSTLPDVDHEILKKLVIKHGSRNIDAIRAELQAEKGVFKNIKAVVEKGKLWIQAVLDKRYKNHIDKFKALSIETIADTDTSTGRMYNPKYLGFSFTNTPKAKNARIAA